MSRVDRCRKRALLLTHFYHGRGSFAISQPRFRLVSMTHFASAASSALMLTCPLETLIFLCHTANPLFLTTIS